MSAPTDYEAMLRADGLGNPTTLTLPLNGDGHPHRYVSVQIGRDPASKRVWALERTVAGETEYALVGETNQSWPRTSGEQLRTAATESFPIDVHLRRA